MRTFWDQVGSIIYPGGGCRFDLDCPSQVGAARPAWLPPKPAAVSVSVSFCQGVAADLTPVQSLWVSVRDLGSLLDRNET